MNDWLKQNAFRLKVAGFGLMLTLPVGLYVAAQAGATVIIWFLLALSAATALLLIRL